MRHVPKLVALLTVAATTLTGTAGLANAAMPSSATIAPTWGTYKTVAPARVLNTRDGLGAPKAPVGPEGVISVQILGAGGLPAAGVSAVVLNVTVTAATKASYLTVWPAGTTRPTVSSINFVAGTNRANLVTMPVSTNGKVSFFNQQGAVQVIADVMGYYMADGATTAGGFYQNVAPERLLDTRDASFGGAVAPGEPVSIPVDYGAANPHIRALAVNITAVSPAKVGYFVSWDGTGSMPMTSTLNFTPGTVTPNMAIVPASPCVDCGTASGFPSITVANGSAGTVHMLVDVVGFYDDGQLDGGLRFKPLTPTRIVDTRKGQGTTTFAGNQTKHIAAPASVAGADTYSLVTNTTAVLPTLLTYLTLWAGGDAKPPVSNLNPAKGQVVANATITDVGPGNVFNVYNQQGATNVLVDVMGTMELVPTVVPVAAAATPRTWTNNAAPVPVR